MVVPVRVGGVNQVSLDYADTARVRVGPTHHGTTLWQTVCSTSASTSPSQRAPDATLRMREQTDCLACVFASILAAVCTVCYVIDESGGLHKSRVTHEILPITNQNKINQVGTKTTDAHL